MNEHSFTDCLIGLSGLVFFCVDSFCFKATCKVISGKLNHYSKAVVRRTFLWVDGLIGYIELISI